MRDYAELFNNRNSYDFKKAAHDADYCVVKQDSTIIVTFQGTQTFTDAVIDLQAIPTEIEAYDGATWKVHSGFKTAYYATRDDVLNTCYSLYKDGDKFLITGHSLGGAMALLAAEDIGWHFNTKVEVVTFGAPRVSRDQEGIDAISSYFTDDSKVFENASDIVPMLPCSYKRFNFVHLGEEFNFIKSINVMKYHLGYDDPTLYENLK